MFCPGVHAVLDVLSTMVDLKIEPNKDLPSCFWVQQCRPFTHRIKPRIASKGLNAKGRSQAMPQQLPQAPVRLGPLPQLPIFGILLLKIIPLAPGILGLRVRH